MLNEPIPRRLIGTLVLLAVSAALSVTAPAQTTERPVASPDAPETPQQTATPTAEQPLLPRAEEAPLEATSEPSSLLDYEPSESISEDKSVSFPIDI